MSASRPAAALPERRAAQISPRRRADCPHLDGAADVWLVAGRVPGFGPCSGGGDRRDPVPRPAASRPRSWISAGRQTCQSGAEQGEGHCTDPPRYSHGGPALSQLGQDTWLTKCEPNKDVLTRRWAAAIAGWAPEAAGLAYRCRHDEDSLAWMLSTAPNRLEHPSLAVGGVRIALDEP